MNDQQRAAMQMAWEYIDWMLSGNLSEPAHEALDVEAALREALAQPVVKESLTVQMQGEWVDLTNDEFETAIRKLRIDETMTLRDWNVGRAVIAKLKEKNTGLLQGKTK